MQAHVGNNRLLASIPVQEMTDEQRGEKKDKELTDSDRKQSVQMLSTILHFRRL